MLGGLLTFDFINPSSHIVLGIVVFILAIAITIVAIVAKQRTRSVSVVSTALTLLITFQIALGFDTLRTRSQIVSWTHFANAMTIYSVAMLGSFLSSKVTKLEKSPDIGAK